MKHPLSSICLVSLALISACGSDAESSGPYDGVPDSVYELIGDVSLTWSYTQGGVEVHEELHFIYSRDDVVGDQLVKKINSKYTLACSGMGFLLPWRPDHICQLSPSNRSDGPFDYDKIELRRMSWTDLNGNFQGTIETEGGLSSPVSLKVIVPKS